jgi:hypothetical protein
MISRYMMMFQATLAGLNLISESKMWKQVMPLLPQRPRPGAEPQQRRPAQTALGVVFSCFLGMLEDWNTLRNGNAWVWNHTTATKWWYLMNLNESYRYNEFAQPNSAYHPQIPASFKSPIRLQVSSNWKRQSSELQGEHLRRCPGNPAGPQIQSDFVQKRGAV